MMNTRDQNERASVLFFFGGDAAVALDGAVALLLLSLSLSPM